MSKKKEVLPTAPSVKGVVDYAFVRKRFEWLTSITICNEMFMHEILMMLEKVPTDQIETMGVCVKGTSFILHYSPAFFEGLTDAEANYIFKHECFHLVLHHCTGRQFENRTIGNIATDLAVNQLIKEDSECQRPTTLSGKAMGCFVEDFRKMPKFKDIEDKQSAEWYYDFLKDKVPQIRITMRGQGQGKGDPQSGDGKDDKNTITVEVSDDHGGWKEDEIAAEIVRDKVNELQKCNKWGNLGSDVVETVLAAQKVKLNWRRFLSRFMGNIVWRITEPTRKRPNRRTGFIHPGNKRIHVDRALLGVDDSGSIESGMLSEFLGVMNSAKDFIPIDVCVFDAEIQSGPKPFDRHKSRFDFKGRGGTNFQPLVDLCVERKYKALIIQTDGCAPAPTKPPANVRVLWVLPNKNCNPPVDWGERIYLTKH